ncbi:asparagine synthase (glutamine-hydrolyzing) [Candidatus Arcticimaribacter forsetii]|uniref:asparagine synthase (glutamine-hydrolyzing) n=1 Tax=Candidatus Arcticimaribacter forsetii TaxID=2820661 RepID=UPI002076F5C0|nr:asparagine synthase (glutamine-hydrolyzing) [Candidatus Arcticimaribacter forsetii]MDB2329287.1 asparagine synthase (glutamine-hydrolyzing) [Flavobacteriaceae bacterium]MDB4674052.1 asparagine synthase (glutamine-hydrolyzing) [Flavobacteriaceae bacterium]
MCGIYLSNIPISKKEVALKLNKISFRGPDHLGILQKQNISLAHLRLSILDLDERSNQPFTYGQFSLVYNGEIYNFKEVKETLIDKGYTFETTSDTEVLLKGYHAWGEKILDRINGMFAFAVYNENDQTVFIARDRLGVKPLYYSWQNGKLELCSQLAPLNKGDLNQEAISIYLQTGYIPSPFSIYEGINKLPPGQYATFDLDKNQMEIHSYWDLKEVKENKISYEEAKEQLHTLIIDAVKIRLQSDVPIGSFLSGGIDSALVSSIAKSIQKDKLKTFTIGFDNKEYDESKVADQFANRIKSDHHLIPSKEKELPALLDMFFKVYDEPFADSSAIPSLLLNKKVKSHVTVALSGDGGDESFLGYNHFEWTRKVYPLFWIPFFLRRFLALFIPFKLFGKRGPSIKNIFLKKNFNEFIESIFTGFDTLLLKDKKKWMSHYRKYLFLSKNKFQKVADLNLKLWLENDSNVKVDRASMASSVEVRSPFLDYRIVEFARKLPVKYRFKGSLRKRILRDILSDYIPENVFNQPKKGFSVPLSDWIRGSFKNDFTTYLKKEKLAKIENLDFDKIQKLFQLHLTKDVDYSSYLWRVYVLSKWIHLNNK